MFLPLAIFGFFAVAALRMRRLTLAYIIAASLVFYGYFDYRYIFLLLASAAVNYAVSIPIFSRCGTKSGKFLAGLGVLFNIALMGYFKYTGFFLENINAVFGTGFSVWKIIPPLGISFFSFQQIAYLVDTYKGQTKKNSPLEYLCFITFFPQIL